MAVIKCKMCGGDLALVEGQSVAECEYCGSKQTVPTADNEKKLTLFARANRLRASCEFDKAAGIYESIVADFPEEAESYWGLVLCKYGIEYVDDPATGKKIPTCHRSSFDSVMDDSNFEQAMENADETALRVYRQEAKAIEEIRKGILAVSSSEKPYDIFICYKETDSKGDRTVDSLLAQDIYDALTGKGYRVFFSRITLENKLGQAYEPYIFAALNSAKIMLAVGTCYEHYSAVWVKNEWSRYLKIIAQDKNKYLIPCYKGLDAYDMPKEFAHLQGQDMGKVGAIADLIRGIEKLMPGVRNNIPAGNNSGPDVSLNNGKGMENAESPMVIRGDLALADRLFEKARGFYEEALNKQPKHAGAYLGVFLSQEECASLQELQSKRIASWEAEVNSLCKDTENKYTREIMQSDKVAIWAEQHQVEPTLTKEEIIRFLNFDRHYFTPAEAASEKLKEMLSDLEKDKNIAKAILFGNPEPAQSILNAFVAIETTIRGRIQNLKEAEDKEKTELEARYAAFLEKKYIELKALQKKRTAQKHSQNDVWKKRKALKKKVRHLFAKEIAVRTDGTVMASSKILPYVARWENVIAVYNDKNDHYYGLRSDGGVYEYGGNETVHWNNIVDICVEPLAGLRADGTVVMGASDKQNQKLVSGWKNVIALYTGDMLHGSRELLGLCADGTVVTTTDSAEKQREVSQWRGIVDIATTLPEASTITFGLRSDGRLDIYTAEDSKTAMLKNKMMEWSNLVAVYARPDTVFGIRGNGKALVLEKSGWNNGDWETSEGCTKVVDIAAYHCHNNWLGYYLRVLFLRSDGSVSGFDDSRKDIIALYENPQGVFVLTSDGRILGCGNEYRESTSLFDTDTTTAFGKLKDLYKDWKLFDNIDSFDAEREKMTLQRAWRKAGACQHCGGELKGFFSKKCVDCGKLKDY